MTRPRAWAQRSRGSADRSRRRGDPATDERSDRADTPETATRCARVPAVVAPGSPARSRCSAYSAKSPYAPDRSPVQEPGPYGLQIRRGDPRLRQVSLCIEPIEQRPHDVPGRDLSLEHDLGE